MKRTAFILALVAIVALSCGKGGNDKAVVSGTISGADNAQIFLSKVEGQEQQKVDSVKIADDGSFTLETPLQHKRFLYVGQVGQKNYIQLIAEPGDDITIDASMNDLGKDYSLEGSEESENVRRLSEMLMETRNNIDSLRKDFQQKSKNTEDKTQLMQMQQDNQSEIQAVADAYYEKKIEFVENHMGDMSSMVGLSGLKINQYFEYYEKVDSALMENYPENPEVEGFHKFVERRKKEVTAGRKKDAKLAEGSKAPDFTLSNPNGKERSLSEMEGNYVLLDFWASWCQPCRRENPNLVDNYEKYNQQGFEIFQVSLDRKRDAWLKGIEEDNLGNWYHVYDANNKVAEMYNIRAIPASFLLDKQGRIIGKNLRGKQLGQRLQQIFN